MIRCVACGAALWLAAAPFATAQLPGSVALDRARLREITGNDTAATDDDPLLIDWVRPLRRIPRVAELRLHLVRPETRVSYNSDIPLSLNDGPLWAGRGWSVSVSGGVRGERDIRNARVRLTVAPTLVYAQNLPFQFHPDSTPGRSPFASPFHGPRASADLPSRFGDRHLLYLDAGRTALTVRTQRVLAGITSESEVWGPGIRNALIMSANAPGIPRLFLQTSAPVHTRVGAVEAKLIAGTLTESLFFDLDPKNDFRSINGILVQLRPAFDSTLTLGLSRVVYAPIVSPYLGPIGHAADVFIRWAYMADPDDTTRYKNVDQIMSAFARWVFPDAGFEVYGEFARMDLPRSFTELLNALHNTGGYTVGFQWAQPRRGHDYLRLQSEITYLEQSQVFYDRAPPPDFYTGRVSPQGYTQRGQVIGAAIGPGASSQWIALDYLAQRWQGGVYVGRIRWENDALYRQLAPNFFRHDVTVLSGARGGWRSALSDVSIEVTLARRYNYLFQNGQANPGGFRTVDVNNLTITLAATPH